MPKIVLDGNGHVYANPDRAVVQLTIEKTKSTAGDALNELDDATQKLIDSLKSFGVDNTHIQTNRLNVAPNYNDNKKILSWSVAHAMTIEVHDTKKVGEILYPTATAGRIDGVLFSNSGAADMLDKARAAAIQDAVQKAQLYCEAAGLNFKEIEEISEQPSGNLYGAVQLFDGECKYSASVRIVVKALKGKMTESTK